MEEFENGTVLIEDEDDGMVFIEDEEMVPQCIILDDGESDGLLRVDVPDEEYLVRISSDGYDPDEGLPILNEAETWNEIFIESADNE